MEVVIVAPGMPFGPRTLEMRSLGGSEQAALLAALELGKIKGTHVTVFCNLPESGSPDAVASGALQGGVRWVSLDQYKDFIESTEVDLLIAQRDPQLLNYPHQARRAVLWAHDLATHSYTAEAVSQLGTNFHEVWCVSEFHRKQFHEITGYPLERIRATRNGCMKITTQPPAERSKVLLYAARPERGLEHLIKQGGIMDLLKGEGFTLKVCMYANYPAHMKSYYETLYRACQERDDTEHMGSLTQRELRQEMAEAFAYVYCTNFEETSCIIMRECAEQGLPVIYSPAGALVESVGFGGVPLEGEAKLFQGNPSTYKIFADNIKQMYADPKTWGKFSKNGSKRKDLYWDGVVKQWLKWAETPVMDSTLFARAWSLVQDADVIPAIALLWEEHNSWDWASRLLYEDLKSNYLFVDFPDRPKEYGLKEHYDRYYKELERPKTNLAFHDVRGQGRWQGLYAELKDLPRGTRVLDYACGEGSQLICLAKELPHLLFYGVDISEDEIECCRRNAEEQDLKVGESNLIGLHIGTTDDLQDIFHGDEPLFGAAMLNEVLEHVYEPWDIVQKVEDWVEPGGRVIMTVPNGPWEMMGCKASADQYKWRAHIWHLDKPALRTMFQDKKAQRMARVPASTMRDLRCLGNTVFSYAADHKGVTPLDPLQKALDANPRQALAASIICMNAEQTILRTLDSIRNDVDVIQFAHGASEDRTREIAGAWLADRPWIKARWIETPKIHAPQSEDDAGFGFDDARNTSVEGLDKIVDWILWIDTDEYLSGNLSRYLTPHAFDSLAIHQHHFSCDPRGTVAQIDRPARLFRTRVGFVCVGKVHEHFEKGANNGPGYCHLSQDLDIGHSGYVNEEVRRGRFNRNFPLLTWDRDANPERQLGKFLWLRDIVHRMMYLSEQGQNNMAGALAQEGVEFYQENRDAMDSFGNGTAQAFTFYGECLRFLGRGLEFDIKISMKESSQEGPSRTTSFKGITDDSASLSAVLEKLVQPEIDKRKSKYWR